MTAVKFVASKIHVHIQSYTHIYTPFLELHHYMDRIAVTHGDDWVMGMWKTEQKVCSKAVTILPASDFGQPSQAVCQLYKVQHKCLTFLVPLIFVKVGGFLVVIWKLK